MSKAEEEMRRQITTRAVRRGDEISKMVEGGFVRVAAETDGLAVELPESVGFLPLDHLISRLEELGCAVVVMSADVEPAPRPARKNGKGASR